MNQPQKVHTLVVEDDPVAVMAIERAFRKAEVDSYLHVAHDGIEALEMLRGDGGHTQLPRPNMILLDLNMPRMDGHEFLAELRQDERLHDSVVFVLSTSSDEFDRKRAYQRAVAGYIEKARAGSSYEELMTMLEPYWDIVDLPE